MSNQFDDNKRHLTALFGGDFPGHALIIDPPGRNGLLGDFNVNIESISSRVSRVEREYEMVRQFHESVGDDAVPFAALLTGTGVHATAFGCPIVLFEGSNPAARPIVHTAVEADALPEPDMWSTELGKHLELVAAVRERLGDDVPITGPDMQSPMGIAALVWEKAEFLAAMIQAPEAVHGLVHKCHNLLKTFLIELHKIAPNLTPIHCPGIWAPKEFGAAVSEDEVGAISRAMFEEFGLWCLVDLSETFGGLFVHCCATADHQYPAFKKIPNLRGLHRNYQSPGAEPCLRAFGDRTVHMEAWQSLESSRRFLDFDVPGVRFAFTYTVQSVDEGKRILETARKWCPRVTKGNHTL